MAAAPAVTRTAGPHDAPLDPTIAASPGPRRPFVVGAVAVAVVVGGLLRLYARSELWLDEALTVNLASVPLRELRGVLARDGAPPLYYVLLHGWMAVFGRGERGGPVAVGGVQHRDAAPDVPGRSTPRRSARVAVAALVLLATSPFAIRYGTEARMYSLVALLVTAGWLALTAALEDPRAPRLVGVGAVSGALLLTHYWSFYLVGVTAVGLALAAWRRPARRAAAVRALAAVVIGSVVLFGPWVPTFLYQAAHTGTPWGLPPGPIEVAFTTLVDLGGGPFPEGQALAGLLAALALLAVFGSAVDARRIELDLRTRPGARRELLVGGVTLFVAVSAGVVTASAFATRYTSVAFPLLILAAAYGFRSFADRRLAVGLLALLALLGGVGGVRSMIFRRTSADSVSQLIAANGGQPGDVVAYCPDQLGPDVARLLPDGYEQLTFPDGARPEIVDWVDYGERMREADPAGFAQQVLQRAAGHTIWYVWMPGYRTLDKQCELVNNALGDARPGNAQLLEPDRSAFERHVLWRHPAPAAG